MVLEFTGEDMVKGTDKSIGPDPFHSLKPAYAHEDELDVDKFGGH